MIKNLGLISQVFFCRYAVPFAGHIALRKGNGVPFEKCPYRGEKMYKKIIFSAALTIILSEAAMAEEGHHTIGAQAGNVGLAGDVGNAYQNSIGAGLFFDYAASDWIEMEVGWLNSHHSGSGTIN